MMATPIDGHVAYPFLTIPPATQDKHCYHENKALRMDLADLFSTSTPFTFRLDHRRSGDRRETADSGGCRSKKKSVSEERFLIFRSDKAGAIAKLIFSYNDNESVQDDDDSETRVLSRATIHCLECKQIFRGHDFGGLLFTEAVNSLRNKLTSSTSSTVHCQLDAEEDERRFGKLISFYERLGCSIKEQAKIRFINNNDGETYRKIPMYLDIHCITPTRCDANAALDRFVPVTFMDENGRRAQAGFQQNSNAADPHEEGRRHRWLLIQNDDNEIEVRTTTGRILCVNGLGCCELLEPGSVETLNSKFLLFRMTEGFDDDPQFSGKLKVVTSLWTIRSVEHEMYLSMSSECGSAVLHCGATPSYWQTDRSYGLTSTSDTPLRRLHYFRHWQSQSVAYVESQKERYLKFDTLRMTLREALDLVQTVPAYPWAHDAGRNQHTGLPLVSVRTLCFQSAEHFRLSDHPDWVQFLAMVYELGTVLRACTSDYDTTDYDWTRSSRSRVLGCPVSSHATFGEFQPFSPDKDRGEYNATTNGMYARKCGLDQVVLTWTGPEYMYHMLVHNRISVPPDALKLLRLAALSDWHSPKGQTPGQQSVYSVICSDSDYEMQSMVADFDEGMVRALRTMEKSELSGEQCESLWKSHYGSIAAKYGCGLDVALAW
jgi:ribosomal protein S18 acetylase RimI-like enzyme